MRSSRFYWLAVLVVLTASLGAEAESETSLSFEQAVVKQAISFMPNDQKSRFTAIEKELIAALKPSEESSARQVNLVYFAEKKLGAGPSELARQFELVRNGLDGGSTYSSLAPALGQLAACVIALSQPHHTDYEAFNSSPHVAFKKDLNASSASLKAEFDGYQRVTDPYEFALNIAKRSNELLKKMGTNEDSDDSGLKSAVFSLAANSLADCWLTLLPVQETRSVVEAQDYIGNKRSKKFHLASCRHLPNEENRISFKTREAAIAEGYEACKVCKP